MALLCPDPILRFEDNNGNALAGGFLYTYQAGTSTPQVTYTDSTGGTANTNPVVLNSRGEANVWLTPGQAYKFILKDSLGNTIWTVDNVNPTQSSGTVNTLTAITGTNSITATCLGINAYSKDQIFAGIAAGTNTGAATININSLGPINLTILGSALVGSEILANDPFMLYYNGTTMEVILPALTAPNLPSTTNTKQIANTAMVQAAIAQQKQIQTVTASISANALTLGLNPASLSFRSATLTDGTINTRSISSAISIVVPSGATLGTINGLQARLAILAMDNAGTVELAAVNLAGGNNLDETTLISTTAISSAATANNVIYSTTARTNLPFRVVGFVDVTEATAGTWATAPSTIQGQGGQALTALSSIGYGQTWQNVVGSRALGTAYYNTTGKPISVEVCIVLPTGGGAVNLIRNGITVTIANNVSTASNNIVIPVSFVVPSGGDYAITVNALAPSISSWLELR